MSADLQAFRDYLTSQHREASQIREEAIRGMQFNDEHFGEYAEEFQWAQKRIEAAIAAIAALRCYDRGECL